MDLLNSLSTTLQSIWPHLVAATSMLLSGFAAAHLVMYKKDTRAAIGWIGVVLMVPILGAVLYALFGINRLQRRAVNLRAGRPRGLVTSSVIAHSPSGARAPSAHLATLEKLVGKLTGRPLLGGNRVEQLIGGEQAYPQMLAAIDHAQRSVSLCSYIFDNDRAGQRFVEALAGAVRRGVEVRVLIDGIGARYSFPSIVGRLREAKVPVALFLPTLLPGRFAYANLRSHRKILVADGRIGFTGGLNIREGHDASLHPRHPIQDHHFCLEGPVVGQMQEVFASDWAFAADELLQGEAWFPTLTEVGSALARGISAGPDGDLEKRRLTLEGALACAETSVTVMTPYFLPEGPLVAALNIAALRGVEVNILLPQANNLALVKWASTALLWQVLERGCRVWMTPPPFDHSKLMLVDRSWALFGSGNWDPRSLRLNFEFDVECYDCALAESLHDLVDRKLKKARQVTLQEVDARSIPVRLRDGVARLLTPYL